MSSKIIWRIVLDVALVFSVIQGWWFAALPLMALGVWSFPYYFEALVAGAAYDSLFGLMPDMGIAGYIGTIVAAIVILVVSGFKKVVRR